MNSATDITAAVQSGTTTARETVARHLELCEEINPEINAFTEIDAEGALSRATQVDAGSEYGPLSGVPIALKDLIDHAGHVTTAGADFYRHHATESATAVSRLEAAGAIVVGRTGMHEFAFGFSSENPWHGAVRNPWDPSLSPGGSSGGSAAAVAAQAVPIAIGTDTGGSVRVPAALCGIVGLKVTHGRIPLTGVFPLAESLDSVGPLARTVDDAALAYEAMAGFDQTDPWSAAVELTPSTFTAVEDLRIAVPTAWLDSVPTTSETSAAFETAVSAMASLGATIERVDAPDLIPTPHLVALASAEAAQVHRQWFTDIDRRYGPDVEERLAAAMEVTVDQHVEARRWQSRLINAARTVFRDYDVILTPTVGHPRKQLGVDTIDVAGKPTFYRPVLSGFTALVNQFGCPAIALPMLAAGTPPPSIQFIAPWWQEAELLDLGRALETIGLVGARMPSGG